jgi:hypothetical protein
LTRRSDCRFFKSASGIVSIFSFQIISRLLYLVPVFTDVNYGYPRAMPFSNTTPFSLFFIL